MELASGEYPLKLTQIERITEYENVIISQYEIVKGDIVMITSNFGRNGMPVELKKRGITTIAFINLKHSKNGTSRHKSGKKVI